MILFTQRTIGHAGDEGGVAAACTALNDIMCILNIL